MMFDFDFTLGDADMAVRVGCGDVGEPGEDVNGNYLGGSNILVVGLKSVVIISIRY